MIQDQLDFPQQKRTHGTRPSLPENNTTDKRVSANPDDITEVSANHLTFAGLFDFASRWYSSASVHPMLNLVTANSPKYARQETLTMKYRSISIVFVLALLAASGCLAQNSPEENVPGRLLVQSAGTADDSVVQQLLARVGAKVHHKIHQIGVSVIDVPEPALNAVSQALQNTGLFTFVERDHIAHGAITPNDPDFVSQWHLTTIQAPNAWD